MRRLLLLGTVNLAALALGAGPKSPDAGVKSAADGGSVDAGTRDAGVEIDAGPPCSNAAVWEALDGGETYSDLLQVTAGETAWLRLPGLAAGFQCDDLQIATLDAVPDGGEVLYATIGLNPGQTDCVFRFGVRGEHRRIFKVTVVPRCRR